MTLQDLFADDCKEMPELGALFYELPRLSCPDDLKSDLLLTIGNVALSGKTRCQYNYAIIF